MLVLLRISTPLLPANLGTHGGTPVGVFRNVQRPAYDDLMAAQLATAVEKRGSGDLAALLHSGETWTIS